MFLYLQLCKDEEKLKTTLLLVRRLYDIVSDHSGRFWCGYNDSPRMDTSIARQAVSDAEFANPKGISDEQWDNMLKVLIRLPHYNIRITNLKDKEEVTSSLEASWLECTRPRMVLRCRIYYLAWRSVQLVVQAVQTVIFYLTTLACLAGILFAGNEGLKASVCFNFLGN